MKDLGILCYFLDIRVLNSLRGLHLTHSKYVKDLITQVGLKDSKSCDTPMSYGKILSKCDGLPIDDQT